MHDWRRYIGIIYGKGRAALVAFAPLSLAWLLLIFLLSGYELTGYLVVHGAGGGMMTVFLYKLLKDLLFWLFMCPWIFFLFAGCYFFSARPAIWAGGTVMALLTVIHILLIHYFSAAMVPLGADLYGYSWNDIRQTAGSAGGIKMSLVIALVAGVAGLVVSIRFASKKIRLPVFVAALLLAAGLLMTAAGLWPVLNAGVFASEFMSNLALNKPDYFIRQSWDHFFPVENETDIYSDNYIGDPENKSAQGQAFRYTDATGYPFLHADSAADVLSPYFNKSAKLPDIVIIVVEGLGRAFTNDGAWLGNFTPFTDSLAGQSLYWRNFLSEGGRTFAVLPSLLASLPFGKNGFLELGAAMPPHLSLISVLKRNGYHSSFYYGGDAHFDNMDLFLQKNGIDELDDEKSFPPGYVKLPSTNGFTWGYNDKELFRHYLDTRDKGPGGPQLSVVLTVSTHSPFRINEQEKYGNLFEQRMDSLGFGEAEKKEHRIYKEQYASILYTDDALRDFFAACSRRENYKNTIFLITGDHRMPEIPMRNKIDRYHVPLIVYSPLLRRKADFGSVSTHFDITPSLLAFLGNAYHIRKPGASHWMGSGLDTARSFRNIHGYPLMQTKTDLVDFVMGGYHLNGNTIFRLAPDMSEEPVNDDAGKSGLKNAFGQFLRRNEKWIGGGRLIPDSLYVLFGPAGPLLHQ